MENSNEKEEGGRAPLMLMGLSTTQETEAAQVSFFKMNNSNENEEGGQSGTVEPAEDPQADDKKIEAERDRLLQFLLNAVEERKDEIFTVRDTKEKKPKTPMTSERESQPLRSRVEAEIIKIKLQEGSSRSNNEVALTFRKRKRKQEHPSRAPMGDGLYEILEAKTWAQPAPSRASSPEMEWPKKAEDNKKKKKETEKYNFPNFALSLGTSEVEKDFMEVLGKKPRRRPTRRPRDVQNELNTIFPGSSLEKITAKRYSVPE